MASLALVIAPGFSVAHGITDLWRHDITLHEPRSIRRKKKKTRRTVRVPSTVAFSNLPLSDYRRRGLALADLRAAGDAQESKHRGHRYGELLHGDTPFVMTA
jgi:hypothetical protein